MWAAQFQSDAKDATRKKKIECGARREFLVPEVHVITRANGIALCNAALVMDQSCCGSARKRLQRTVAGNKSPYALQLEDGAGKDAAHLTNESGCDSSRITLLGGDSESRKDFFQKSGPWQRIEGYNLNPLVDDHGKAVRRRSNRMSADIHFTVKRVQCWNVHNERRLKRKRAEAAQNFRAIQAAKPLPS